MHLSDLEIFKAVRGEPLPIERQCHLKDCPDCGSVVFQKTLAGAEHSLSLLGTGAFKETLVTEGPRTYAVGALGTLNVPYKGAAGEWAPYNANPNRCPQCKGALAADECIVEECFGCGFDLSSCDENLLETLRKEANVEEKWDGVFGTREAFDPPRFPNWALMLGSFMLGLATSLLLKGF